MNNGFGDLFPRLPEFGNLFDFANSGRPDLNPPVVAENLNETLQINNELGNIAPPSLPELFAMKDLVDALEALGFEILEIEGGYTDATHNIPDTTLAGDLILLRYQKTFADLHGSTPFDDSTSSLLDALNPAADLNGSLDYDASLTLDFLLGVDSEIATGSFFLLGQSAFRLDLNVAGEVSAAFDVPLGDLGIEVAGAASADLSVVLG